MAVEDPQVNLFSQRFISSREMMDQGNQNVYEEEVKFEYAMDQMFVSSDDGEFAGLPVSTKRSCDTCQFDDDPLGLTFLRDQFVKQNELKNEEGMFMQIYQQEVEIDSFIAHHMEKMRSEIEANRRRNWMRLFAAVEEGVKKRLRSKEDEIINLGRLNRALEEKVRSLNVENQIWQQMAQANEDTANVLRLNLQQLLTQQQQQQHNAGNPKATGATADDAESCTGSNYDDDYRQQRTLEEVDILNQGDDMDAYCTTTRGNNGSRLKRWCRNCGKEELSVLLLPCRHLCICTVCESSISVCPICNSVKNGSVHVNMNSF